MVNEHKTKDAQGQGSSNINLNLFVSFFDVHNYPRKKEMLQEG